jgi:nicotinamidase-related amidase
MPHPALLTIDVQNDFVAGPAAVEGTAACLPQIARLVGLFRAAGAPIIHAVRLYAPDGGDAEPFRRDFIRTQGPVVAPGSPGAALPTALGVAQPLDAALLYSGQLQRAGPSEWILYKPRWDAFYATALEQHLRALNIDTLVVCGCNLPNCPRATLFGASNRDFRTILVRDATSRVTPERLADLALMGTEVMGVDETARFDAR